MIYSDIFRCTANHRRIDELHTFVSMMPGRPDWSDICSAAPFQAVSPAPIQSVYFAGYLRQVVFMFDKLDKRDAVEISARLMERFKASTACVTSSKDIPPRGHCQPVGLFRPGKADRRGLPIQD